MKIFDQKPDYSLRQQVHPRFQKPRGEACRKSRQGRTRISLIWTQDSEQYHGAPHQHMPRPYTTWRRRGASQSTHFDSPWPSPRSTTIGNFHALRGRLDRDLKTPGHLGPAEAPRDTQNPVQYGGCILSNVADCTSRPARVQDVG